MVQRKLNAGLSLLSTVFVFYHAIHTAVWALSRGSIPKSAGFMAWILTGLTVAHALISIDLAISGHASAPKGNYKSYPKMNVSTIIQRITGVLMMIFAGLHIAGAMKLMQPPKPVHAVVPPLFFVVVLVHVSVSTSKAFITLGIGTAKTVKVVDVIVKAFCALTLIACMTGFYLYLV